MTTSKIDQKPRKVKYGMRKDIKENIIGIKKYTLYVLKHKRYVGSACRKMGLYWQGFIHDWSKFLPSEFWRYMRKFSVGDKSVEDEFNISWLKHIHRNPHHRQHWIKCNDDGNLQIIEMPEKYVKEMLCDWWGVGRSFANSSERINLFKFAPWHEVYAWYNKNKDKMSLHANTRNYVEVFLENKKMKNCIEGDHYGIGYKEVETLHNIFIARRKLKRKIGNLKGQITKYSKKLALLSD